MQIKKSHIIVIGNEKGGAGKTTTSMHLIISLLRLGFKVTSIDADCRQKSLSRYLENRTNYALKHNVDLVQPRHFCLSDSIMINDGNNRVDNKKNDNRSNNL
ncbi:MAG: AAA family ATPase, partial [Rickettsiaceae bacterium]|nr:AAA family ATPase [Rickettsiaceae bacterium]